MSQGERFASYWTQHPTEGLSLRRVRVSANPPCTEPLSVQAPTRDETVLVAEAGHPADEFSPSASDGPLGERSVFRGRSTCVGE